MVRHGPGIGAAVAGSPTRRGIKRTAHAARPLVRHMGVDHRGLHARVTEQLLEGADVLPGPEQVGGKRVTARVAARRRAHQQQE